MPPEQLDQVLEAIPRLNLRKFAVNDVAMLFEMSYWLVLRISETMKLKVEDFDFDREQVFLGKTKTESVDYAVIPRAFVNEIKSYIADKEGLLFPGFSYITTYKWIEKLGKMLNIIAWTKLQEETHEKTKTHIFRKSMAKDMMYGTYSEGRKAPINVISRQLRHKGKSAFQVTERYLRVGDEAVKEWWKEQEENKSKEIDQ